jgi:hypothetical protein
MPLDAKVLLGWMERDHAVRFLTEGCAHALPLTEAKAEGLWRPFRDTVEAMPERQRMTPAYQKLSKSEREHAREFLRRVKKFNRDVTGVIKVDLMDVSVYQLLILTGRSADYRADVITWSGWRKNCLRPQCAPRSIPTRTEPPNVVVFELPHAEFLPTVTQTPTGPQLALLERPKWVTVTLHDGRLLLWAGYHRSYARMIHEEPAMGERAVPVVLVSNRVAPAENTAAVTVATGLRPPLFRDFFDESFFMTVRLRRKRYEMRATFNGDQVTVSPVLELWDE